MFTCGLANEGNELLSSMFIKTPNSTGDAFCQTYFIFYDDKVSVQKSTKLPDTPVCLVCIRQYSVRL